MALHRWPVPCKPSKCKREDRTIWINYTATKAKGEGKDNSPEASIRARRTHIHDALPTFRMGKKPQVGVAAGVPWQ